MCRRRSTWLRWGEHSRVFKEEVLMAAVMDVMISNQNRPPPLIAARTGLVSSTKTSKADPTAKTHVNTLAVRSNSRNIPIVFSFGRLHFSLTHIFCVTFLHRHNWSRVSRGEMNHREDWRVLISNQNANGCERAFWEVDWRRGADEDIDRVDSFRYYVLKRAVMIVRVRLEKFPFKNNFRVPQSPADRD